MKTLLLVMSLAACSESGRTPDPWGVPLTGGTMIVTKSNHAVVADPDRDRILSVDINTRQVISEVALDIGSEPGRVTEDGAGRIHVATRRGGQLLTFSSATLLGEPLRRSVCAEPRGVAYEATNDRVHVACAGGELVTFNAESGQAIRTVHLDRDLRDIVVQGTNLIISRFRSAELLTVDSLGFVVNRASPPTVTRFRFDNGPLGGGPEGTGQVQAVPTVAWRTVAAPDGTVYISHQRHVKATLDADRPDGYGGEGCPQSPAPDAVSIIKPGQSISTVQAIHRLGRGALPVDIAISPTNDKIALLVAGTGQVRVIDKLVAEATPDEDNDGCEEPPPCPDGKCEPPPPPPPCDGCEDDPAPGDGGGDSPGGGGDQNRLGMPTSIGWTTTGDVVVFYPELPGIQIRTAGGPLSQMIRLSGGAKSNPGRTVFHQQTNSGLTCASCHPEAREDGVVWSFRTLGQRRTQSLAGDILARAPYHWAADERNLAQLMDDVFAVRMGGGAVSVAQKESLGPWLNTVPAPAPFSVNAEAAARGRELFNTPEAACGTCHNGAVFTNNTMADVGVGGSFKVPSLLGVGSRAPFMHDGRAKTLTERFGPLGGGDSHGRTSHMTQAQVADLVAYLESL